ncbi:hypothetical protein QAD02_001585, partial [Eretmocerus hayati]
QNKESIPDNRLNAWEIITKVKQEFWRRWHHEYLNNLNVRQRKRIDKEGLPKTGQLVLIKEDNVPPMRWKLGRIHELHPGTDEVARAATIRTTEGLKKRPTTRLAILPIEDR